MAPGRSKPEMTAQRAKIKEKRGLFATIFLGDPWRKLLALAVGFAVWYYISAQILTTQTLAFRVVEIASNSTNYEGYSLNVPVPDGFTLSTVDKTPFLENPKVLIRFQGPHNRMQLVTEDLRLAIPPEKFATLREGIYRFEIAASEINVPQNPQLKELIQTFIEPGTSNPGHLVLTFERFLQDEEFTLGKGESLIQGGTPPEGYQIDSQREVWFQPGIVRLSGSENLLHRQLRTPGRERLLEDFVLQPELRVQKSATDETEVVQVVGLRQAWKQLGLSMSPPLVSMHLPLQRVPDVINIPGARLEIELTGPNADQEWQIAKGAHPDRPVIVEVYDKNAWRVINDFKRLTSDQKPDFKAQEKWVRENVRLLVNVSHLDPERVEEQSARIHAKILPDERKFPFERLEIKVLVLEGDNIAVRRRR